MRLEDYFHLLEFGDFLLSVFISIGTVVVSFRDILPPAFIVVEQDECEKGKEG